MSMEAKETYSEERAEGAGMGIAALAAGPEAPAPIPAADRTPAPAPQPPGNGRCAASKDGRRCRGRAMTGSRYCFFHNPEAAEARALAQRAGGEMTAQVKRDLAEAGPPDFASATSMRQFLAQVAHDVRCGRLAPAKANAMVKATECALRLAQLEMSEAVRKLEEAARRAGLLRDTE